MIADDRMGLPSASKRDRWSACPGSFELEKLVPDAEAGEAAEKGNRIHDALHSGDFSTLAQEEAELAERLSVLEKVAVSQWLNVIGSQTPIVERERRIGFRINDVVSLTGKPDVVYSCLNSFLVLDYKTGSVLVDSVGNQQLRALAVMFSQNHPEMVDAYIAIIQNGQDVVLERLSDGALGMESEKLRNELERLSSQRGVRFVGPHCQYCKASGVCPEAQGATKALASVSTKELINAADLPKLLDSCVIAESVIDAVKKRAREYLAEGGAIRGWKIQTQNRRYITDAPEALNRLAEVVGMHKAISAAEISISSAEELIMANEKCTKKDASQQLGSLLADLIETRPINKLTRSK